MTTFPLVASGDGHYIVDAVGTPFPLLMRTTWCLMALDQAGREAVIDDSATRGFTAIEAAIPCHFPNNDQDPFDGEGNLPFSKAIGGADWTGSLSVDADFTTPVEAYWANVDDLIEYAATKNMVVCLFPAYAGVTSGSDGWRRDWVANGVTKMETYGWWLGTRYKNKGNIVWMLGGDYGLGSGYEFTANERAAQQAIIDGLESVTNPQSVHYSNEWHGDSIGTDQANFGGYITINGCYSWNGNTASICRTGYADSPALPAFLQEGPFDLEGPDGINFNPASTQPIRRYSWWAWLGAIGGVGFGNYYIWRLESGYASYLGTTQTQHQALLHAFIASKEWWKLVPDGLGSIGTLITAGKGTIDTTTYVAAAADPAGSLLVAYVGPGHTGTVTVDMTKMDGSTVARWFDPTSGDYSAIGTYANTGTRAFTTPGNNDAGDADWVLVLELEASPPAGTPVLTVS